MPKVEEYRTALAGLKEWDRYLMENSGLPGPRGNLELAEAAASLGDIALFRRYVSLGADVAPENTPEGYLVMVGVWGLGWLAARGKGVAVEEIRPFASDSRWRVREAAAIALQAIGDIDTDLFRKATAEWSTGNRLEQRAAIAGLAEPRLLKSPGSAQHALAIHERVTSSLLGAPDASSEEARVLRQALGYAWSVVIVQIPDQGKAAFEALLARSDPDARWIVRENLKKNRLVKMDAAWVEECRKKVA